MEMSQNGKMSEFTKMIEFSKKGKNDGNVPKCKNDGISKNDKFFQKLKN